MTTSRTGTASHKRMTAQVLREAQAIGITHCPGCGTELDYENRTQPNGAQADEIVPFAVRGHTSTNLADWQVLCARCNQIKGKRVTSTLPQELYPMSRNW